MSQLLVFYMSYYRILTLGRRVASSIVEGRPWKESAGFDTGYRANSRFNGLPSDGPKNSPVAGFPHVPAA